MTFFNKNSRTLEFTVLLLAGIGLLFTASQINFYTGLDGISISEETQWQVLKLTSPGPLYKISESLYRERQEHEAKWRRDGFLLNFLVALHETRFQILFVLVLFVLQKFSYPAPYPVIISHMALLSIAALFALTHLFPVFRLFGGIVLNVFAWYYWNPSSPAAYRFAKALFPPFFLHLLWNLLNPLVKFWV